MNYPIRGNYTLVVLKDGAPVDIQPAGPLSVPEADDRKPIRLEPAVFSVTWTFGGLDAWFLWALLFGQRVLRIPPPRNPEWN